MTRAPKPEVPEIPYNPYAPSHSVDPEISRVETKELSTRVFVQTFLIWTCVCLLSAAPSFIIAFGDMAKSQVIALVLGILIFIVIYTSADLLSRDTPARKNTRFRSILRATFIIRSVMVVIFPIATVTDIFLGLFSVGIVFSVLRFFKIEFQENAMGFGMVLATTLVQGCLLSIFLFFLGLLITVFQFILRSLFSQSSIRRATEKEVIDNQLRNS